MSDPVKGFMLPPPSPKSIRGDTGLHETPTDTDRMGFRMADLYANLPAVPKTTRRANPTASSLSGRPQLARDAASSRPRLMWEAASSRPRLTWEAMTVTR
ncbi:hypothetical protein E2562_005641 [Oryza meyeriana var. granulata]|uniref:Uncharacterized protein n=1 Tax=Oryza meyeriana var. granulata TaxID=110450 RepID=A0A6G1BJ24_9ORYZ|nr:hypothetical protein E2562_005641 [Oryza meyeriana var. granulata]